MSYVAGRNLRMSPHEYALHLPDWTFLNKSFDRGIRVSDIDGFVEKGGHFLFFEWGWPSKGRSRGQRWALDRLARQPKTSVVFIRGKVDLVVDWRAIGEEEGIGTDGESLERYVREWNDAQT